MVLEKTLESPLNCKGIQPVHPKKDHSWVFIVRTDSEAETPIFGHLRRRLTHWKTLILGGIEGRRKLRWLDGITDLMDVSLSELLELA